MATVNLNRLKGFITYKCSLGVYKFRNIRKYDRTDESITIWADILDVDRSKRLRKVTLPFEELMDLDCMMNALAEYLNFYEKRFYKQKKYDVLETEDGKSVLKKGFGSYSDIDI